MRSLRVPLVLMIGLLLPLVPPLGAAPAGADTGPNGQIVFDEWLCCSYDIWVVNPDGTGLTNLTNTPDVAEFDPVWSPDGSRISFTRDADIWVMNADGSGQVDLHEQPGDRLRRGLVTGRRPTSLRPPGAGRRHLDDVRHLHHERGRFEPGRHHQSGRGRARAGMVARWDRHRLRGRSPGRLGDREGEPRRHGRGHAHRHHAGGPGAIVVAGRDEAHMDESVRRAPAAAAG